MYASMRIRAHHLMCMQGFQGYGYSDDFANHLQNIVTQLTASPDTLIQIVVECDDICNGCPNYTDHKCQKDTDSDYHFINMDSSILKNAGIEIGSIYKFSYAVEQINWYFKNRTQLTDFCGDCQWTEKCTWYMSLR